MPVNIGRIESFGGAFVGPAGYFDGLIDEVELFGRALSAGEILALYETGSAGKCKGTPFSEFMAGKARLDFAAVSGFHDRFEVQGAFTLGEASNGIWPGSEEVVVSVGTSSLTIPAGSFERHGDKFEFAGTIGEAEADAEIRDLGANRYDYTVQADGVDLSGTANPVDISLTIGDDNGGGNLRLKGKLMLGGD